MEGWIKLHRKIQNHWIWRNEKYYRAWSYILFKANFTDNKVLIKSSLIACQRGQLITSLGTFGRELGMTVQQVRTFWNLLESDSMINREVVGNVTRLTVLNYERYQVEQHVANTQLTTSQHEANTLLTTVKKEKKVKNEKKTYREMFEGLKVEFIMPTGYDELLLLWLQYKSERGEAYKPTGMKVFIRKTLSDYPGTVALKSALEFSMSKNYSGIYADKAVENNKFVAQGRKEKPMTLPADYGVPTKTSITREEFLKQREAKQNGKSTD